MFKDNVGNLVKHFREDAKVSQEDLANYIGISRITYINSENGLRLFKEEELKKISDFLEISINSFMVEEKSDRYRDLKDLILYIAQNSQEGLGKVVLNKLLYFSDFNYYEWTGSLITGSKYIKLPYGPVPDEIDEVLKQMVENGEIAIQIETVGNYKRQKIVPVKKANESLFKKIDRENFKIRDNYIPYSDLPSSKIIVDDVLSRFRAWPATKLSEYSHMDVPYKAAKKIGDTISPELVFYRATEFVVNHHNL